MKEVMTMAMHIQEVVEGEMVGAPNIGKNMSRISD
jgi:hypothetical protein